MNVIGLADTRLGRRDPTGRRAAAQSVVRRRGIGAAVRAATRSAWPTAWKGAAVAGLIGALLSFDTGAQGFESTADVLVRPNAVDATFFQNDTGSLLDTEVAVLRSSEVIAAAARTVPRVDPAGLATSLSVHPDARHSTLRISVLAEDPELARTLANALASAYLASIQTRAEVTRRSTVSVLHEATAAVRTDEPTMAIYAIVGALLGGIVAFAMSAVWKLLDPRLLDPSDLELMTGRPLVGRIPISTLDESRLVMIADPTSAAADSYRSLVSKIPFFALEEGVRCVAVTGSSHGDIDAGSGPHSDVASNLAVACAHSGIRTMLVSGDLRHEAILARQLKPESPGLTDLILARAPWRELPTWQSKAGDQVATGDVVYMTNIDNLTFVPTGRTAPNPGDVLSSRAAGVALSHLKHLCDLVILDTPDYANPETGNIVRYAEAVIAVVHRRATRKAALRTLAASTDLQAVPLYFVLKDTSGRRRSARAATKAQLTSERARTATPIASESSPAPDRAEPRPQPVWWTPPIPVDTTPPAPPAPPPPPPSTPPPAAPPAPASAPVPAPADVAPPSPPTVRPTALPERPERTAFASAGAEPSYSSVMTATVRRAPLRSRASGWNQARLSSKRRAQAVRRKAREEIERLKPPPRGKQY